MASFQPNTELYMLLETVYGFGILRRGFDWFLDILFKSKGSWVLFEEKDLVVAFTAGYSTILGDMTSKRIIEAKEGNQYRLHPTHLEKYQAF